MILIQSKTLIISYNCESTPGSGFQFIFFTSPPIVGLLEREHHHPALAVVGDCHPKG